MNSSNSISHGSKSRIGFSALGGRFVGPSVILLAVIGSCVVVWLAQMVGHARAHSSQDREAKALTCEAVAQYEIGPSAAQARGLAMSVAMPNDGRFLSVKYRVREIGPELDWHDCDTSGSDCYPPGNAWFSEFTRSNGPDGQEFGATAWNGSRYAQRLFRITVAYTTGANICTSITPVTVHPGGSEPLTGSAPLAAHVEGVRAEVKDDASGKGWHPCQWGADCGAAGDLSLSPVKQSADQGGTSMTYKALLTSKAIDRDRSARIILTYVP